MQLDEQEDTTIYKVVMNHEEQYSIWPADRETPLGWHEVGTQGYKQECLTYIEEVWTDMRPLSLRQHMAAVTQRPVPPTSLPRPVPVTTDSKRTDDLVQRLCTGDHPVQAAHRSAQPVQALQESIERGYVPITFTGTRGGTELGVRLDRDHSDLTQADFTHQTGMVHLEGQLTLNYRPVRCVADIDLHTLQGYGHLVPIQALQEQTVTVRRSITPPPAAAKLHVTVSDHAASQPDGSCHEYRAPHRDSGDGGG